MRASRREGKNPRPGFEAYRIAPAEGHVAVLASGGLDSAVLLGEVARDYRQVHPVYIRAGLAWERQELAALKRFIAALGRSNIRPPAVLEVRFDDLDPHHWSVSGRGVPGYNASVASNYIPGRNLALVGKAAAFCATRKIGILALALLAANPFPDARPEFFASLMRTVELGLVLDLRIVTPFSAIEKDSVVRLGQELPLHLTVSCVRPRGLIHCGACTKCAERIEAFRRAGVTDPTRYGLGPSGRR